ncbi:MAG: hypothetical protein GY769_07905 [bacterium]|nr:hypothetical protein [bacterium]
MRRLNLLLAYLMIAIPPLLAIFGSACLDSRQTTPTGVEAPTPEETEPAATQPAGSGPTGLLEVSTSRHDGAIHARVTNTTPEPVAVLLCSYDCGETEDCRTALQTLYRRTKRKVIQPNTGALLSRELACFFQWDVLRENDPRETKPVTCPETYRWGQDYPGLELLEADTGNRSCVTTTTTIPEPEKWCDPERKCIKWGWVFLYTPQCHQVCVEWATEETQMYGRFPGPEGCPPSYAGRCDGRSAAVQCPD